MLLFNRGFPFLGATVDPLDADKLCLEQHHLEFYFLGAFVASDVDVRRVENGAAFVLPSRLNDAFDALVTAGLDLALDERVTELNGLGPTVFLTRMSAAIELLPQLLELQLDGLISIHECDQDVDEETWPSHMAIGSLLCPTTESMRPFADLRGLQGFFLGKDLCENPDEQFHASASAIAAKVMTNSLKSLNVVHYPRQVALDGWARLCGCRRSLLFASNGRTFWKRWMNALHFRQRMLLSVRW